jgi:probable phosphoglycerate mutase
VLVRHGETPDIVDHRFQGRRPTRLSPLGRRQVALTGRRLARPHDPPALPIPDGPPAVVLHSPLARCAETATAIAEALAAADGFGSVPRLEPDDGLSELSQGAWEGLRLDEIAARYGPELAAWRRRPAESHAPGGESLREADVRLRPSIARLAARLAEGREPGTHDRSQVPTSADPFGEHPWAILVGHDGIFKLALLALFEMPLERFWFVAFPLAGITIVELRAGRPVLRGHGITEHLVTLSEQVQEEEDRGGAL